MDTTSCPQVPDQLSDPVARQLRGLERIDECSTLCCSLIAHLRRFGLARVVIELAVRKKKRFELLRGIHRRRRVDAELIDVPIDQRDDALRETTGVRKVQRDLKVSQITKSIELARSRNRERDLSVIALTTSPHRGTQITGHGIHRLAPPASSEDGRRNS